MAIWRLILVTFVLLSAGCAYDPPLPNTNYGVGDYYRSIDSDAPCVYGYCGPVHVRGYYRKDGTYVRPHTRSLPRR